MIVSSERMLSMLKMQKKALKQTLIRLALPQVKLILILSVQFVIKSFTSHKNAPLARYYTVSPALISGQLRTKIALSVERCTHNL
jgi:hypothetical protein